MEIQVIEQKKKLLEKLRVCAYCRVSTEEESDCDRDGSAVTHPISSIMKR